MENKTLSYYFHKTLRGKLIVFSMIVIVLAILIICPIKLVQVANKDVYNNTAALIGLSIAITIICLLIIYIIHIKVISNKKMEEAFLELRQITNSIHAGFVNFILDENYEIIYASNGFYKIIGYSKEEIHKNYDNSLMSMVIEEDHDKIRELENGLSHGDYIQREVQMRTKDHGLIWILINGNYVVDANGNHTISAVLVDITSSKQMQERLLLEEERYRVAAEISNDILFEYDIDLDLMIFADKYKELYGREPNIHKFSQCHNHMEDMIHPEDLGVFGEYCRALRSGKEMIESEFRICDRFKDYVWCHTRGKTIYDDNKRPSRVIGKVVNIDLHKKELQTLEYKAKRDPLTGVFNKSTTKEMIDQYIGKHEDGQHIFMIIDIDDFKSVNDCYGHLQGDKVLSFVISQIKMIFTAGEVIGRIGGDEFVVFIGDIANKESIIMKAELLQRVLRTTYNEGGYEVSVSGSIGVSMYPQDGNSYNDLLNCADKALYDVKEQGKDGYKLFT